MKQKLILPFLFCLFIQAVHAQSFHAGVKAGLNFSKNDGNGMGNFQTGYDAGVFGQLGFGKKWAVQPEVYYSQRNTNRSDDFLTYYNVTGNPVADKKVKLGYISIPVLLHYHIKDWLSVQAGPQYNLMVYDDENLLTSGKKAFKKNDFGLAGGVEVTQGRVIFYGRYYHGLSNINNADERYEWKARQIQAGIGYRIL